MGINIIFQVIVISKIRHQTCQISDFHTECYMGGGGSDLHYGLRQAEHFIQLKIGKNQCFKQLY